MRTFINRHQLNEIVTAFAQEHGADMLSFVLHWVVEDGFFKGALLNHQEGFSMPDGFSMSEEPDDEPK